MVSCLMCRGGPKDLDQDDSGPMQQQQQRQEWGQAEQDREARQGGKIKIKIWVSFLINN